MGRRAYVWSGMLLAVGALYGVTAPWSYALPPCTELPAAQRERERLEGRCAGRAPIVNVTPGGRAGAVARRPVPDLRGRRFDNNDQRLATFVIAIDYRESAVRRDWVVDQVPRPPATLPIGGNLRVVLSDGALVRVPDVRGSFARALATLHRAGLGWSAADASTGRVIGQQPSPGTAVRPGTQIVLRIGPGPVALAPESTRPDIAPPARPAPPPATVPAPPPAGTTAPPPAPRTPPATSPAPGTAPSAAAMPDLQGLIFEAARTQLAGFNVQRIHRAGAEPGGTVIGQSPAAGTPLAPGQTVRLVLSDGSLVRVPRVMSFTLTEARQRLAHGELRPVVTSVASDTPAGTVVSQQPAEGQIAARGSTVRLTVSSGPAAAPAPLPVPNVVGGLAERVRPQLERFRVERTERAAREPVGTILEQSPPAGSLLEAGGTVSIIVSSGGRPEAVEVVDVVGRDADAASSALSEFRLEREAVPSVEPAGRVLAQDPAPGAAAAPGSTVRLRVSDGSRVLAPSLANRTLAEARDAAQAAGVAVAVAEGSDEAGARVLRQSPAPGAEVARGSAVQLTVQAGALPFGFDLPPAVRDAGDRAAAALGDIDPRIAAIVVVLLAALLALALLARRRGHARYVLIEPKFEPHATAHERGTDEPAAPPAPREAASRRAALTAEPRTPKAAPPPMIPASVAAPAREAAAAAEVVRPPAAPSPAIPAAIAVPRATTDAPAAVAARAPSRLRVFGRRAPPPAVLPPPAPETVAFGAVARVDADPERTVAVGAAPRGPEIRIAARLDTGDGRVRELPSETAPDALTEENR